MRDFFQTRNRGILEQVLSGGGGLCLDAADYAHTATDVHRPMIIHVLSARGDAMA